jgi:hypothetical protein|tara:strand:- start:176 stop:784 length:609 start_codon:yes stop_codon:yes gene_type:complete
MALPTGRKEREYNKFVESVSGNVAVRTIAVSASGADVAHAEDSEHTSGDTGIQMLSVRNDTLSSLGGTDGDYSPLQVNADGALYVEVASTSGSTSPTVTNATGSAAIATSTSLSAAFRLSSVTLLFNTAPTTSENFTVTLNANDGSAYDAVLYTEDPSATSATSLVFIPDGDLVFESGDELDVAYTNTDSRTYGLRIVTQAV